MHEFYRRHLDLFAQMERWPHAHVLAYQAARLERLARYMRDHVPVFADRVRPLFDGDEFRLGGWPEVPILKRRELQEATPALETIEPPAEMGELRSYSTSGSTGQPVRVRHTAFSRGMIVCMRERLYRWHRFEPHATVANILVSEPGESEYPDGTFKDGWSQYDPLGRVHYLNLFTPVEQQLEWLSRIRPRYLFTSATNMMSLAAAVRLAKLEIPLDAAIAVGTKLVLGVRETVAEAFGARVIETYNSNEFGPIAHQCDESELLHICPEHLIVEVLGDDDKPVSPGETARVVVTGLYNFATPLLRYEIGDLAETASDPCICGRSQPAFKRLIGRTRRALTFPDGRQVITHTAIVAAGMPEFLPARQCQVVHTGPERFEIRYVPDGSGRPPDLEQIRDRFRTMVHPRATVELVSVASIPLSRAGKYEDFVYLEGAA
jgi:phenylacetate-CoA ligase